MLDARALPKNATSTLADLYDPDTMPGELRKAHRELDLAVDRLYRRAPFGSDRERVEHLFTLYQRLADPLTRRRPPEPPYRAPRQRRPAEDVVAAVFSVLPGACATTQESRMICSIACHMRLHRHMIACCKKSEREPRY